MSNWTRAHDAHIARECEGLEVDVKPVEIHGFDEDMEQLSHWVDDQCRWDWETEDGKWVPVDAYNLDASAAIRAAEAWRTKDEDIDRTVSITSPIDRLGIPCKAECSENYREGDGYKWRIFKGEAGDEDEQSYAAASAWALYRATGGAE
jgi:hypothetical protein